MSDWNYVREQVENGKEVTLDELRDALASGPVPYDLRMGVWWRPILYLPLEAYSEEEESDEG